MAGSSHTHSSLLAALDGPHLDDPPSGPSTSSYSPTMGMHNNTRFDNAMDTSADTAEAARQALKRKLDAVAPITQASRFAPMFSPQRNVRRRVEDSRHAEFAQASASAISMLGYGDSSPMRGLSPTRSSRSVRRAPGEEDDTPVRAPPGTSMFEFALHYDTESAVRTMDVGGHDQEQKMEEFIHKSLKDMNHGRTVEEGMKVLGMSSMKDVIPGMNVRLLRHQVVGVSWMLDQERSKYKGGILADDMGLGKTVQMIATMVMNPPDEDSDVKTTLIVLPTALLQQWKDELENKTNGMFDVHIHHGTKKIKKLQDMKAKDVILTTYHTLAGECTIGPDVEEAEEVAWVQKNGGLLARMHWYRVVVDEAQFIRNRKTFSSRAVAMLRSQYRWCLTGTPVTNTLVDVWAFLRFGRFRPWNDWKDFDAHVGRVMAQDPALAGMRTQEILNPVMMRRQKNAKEVDGRPLVELPSKEIEIVHLDFSKEEREIYDSMERKARIRVNRFIKRGTLLKNHHYVLVLILRLRQASCHPFLLSDENGNIGDPSMIVGSEMDKELARAQRLMPAQWIKDVQARFMLRKQAEEFDFPDDAEIPEDTCPVCIDVMTEDSGRVLECGHEMCHECLMDLNKSALQTTGEVRHSEQDEKLWEAAAAKGHRPCPKCHKMVSLAPDHVFRSYAFIPDEEDVERAIKKRKQMQRKQRQAKKGAKKTTFMEIDDSDDEIEIQDAKKGASNGQLPTLDSDDEDMPDMFDLIAAANREKKPTVKDEKKDKKPKEEDNVDMSDDEQGDARAERNMDQAFYNNSITTYSKSGQSLAPSTKMIYMIDKLKEWDACGDKTIVYSQWTSYLDLIEDLFLRHGIRSLRYDGRMGREAREMTLKQFREPGGPKVICISIKCGGVGLNLVSANRVINLDLSWNYATESQAYDRVHRMGQEKDVTIKRLVIKDTLEERMLRLQDLKTSLSDAALGEGTGMKLHKLSVKEIKTLFGFQNVQSSQDRDQNRDP